MKDTGEVCRVERLAEEWARWQGAVKGGMAVVTVKGQDAQIIFWATGRCKRRRECEVVGRSRKFLDLFLWVFGNVIAAEKRLGGRTSSMANSEMGVVFRRLYLGHRRRLRGLPYFLQRLDYRTLHKEQTKASRNTSLALCLCSA